jgi:hypothetical protein
MRPDRAGMELLLQVTPARAVNAFWRLNPAAVPTAIPRCIAWLTHPDSEVRARAESCLIKWTGQSFGHDWEGYSYQRPTMEEAEKIQPRWQEWWEQNKSSFRP